MILHHHWVRCDGRYANERQRVQTSLSLLLVAYTGVRPGSILHPHHHIPSNLSDDEQKLVGEYSSHEDPHDCLKYRDIDIFKVRGDGENDLVFLMLVTIRLQKGMRNKALP